MTWEYKDCTIPRLTEAPTTSSEAPSTKAPTTSEAPSTEAPPTSTEAPSVILSVRPNEVGTFIDNSPQIGSGKISINLRFSDSVAKAVCSLLGQPDVECTSGAVQYNVSTDTYKYMRLVIRATMINGNVKTMRRVIKIGPPHLCIVNFINDGVTVFSNGTALLDFTSSGPTSTFLCSMDFGPLLPCVKGQLYFNLESATHRIKVVPDHCGRNRRNGVMKFTV